MKAIQFKTKIAIPIAVGLAVVGIACGGENTPPTADFTFDPPAVARGDNFQTEVVFTATASDLDGDRLTYEWKFKSGRPATASGPVATATFPGVAPYLITLTVSDGKGGEVTVTKTVPLVEEEPDPTVIEVANRENPYFFEPSDITLEAGKSYRFINVAPTEFHTFTIEELGIDVAIDGGTTVETDYTATHPPGTYRLVCLVHEAQGMVGTITIS